MQCLVIDDNPKTAATLTALLEQQPGIAGVHRAIQPYLVSSLMAAEPIGIIFSRVRLWNYRPFNKLEQMPVMVFLSGGRDKLATGGDFGVPYQLRKPYDAKAVAQVIRNIHSLRIVEEPGYFFVRSGNRHHRIFFKDIQLLERMRMNYVRLDTQYQSFLLPGSIVIWLQQLPEDRFVRVSDTLVLPVSEVDQIKDDAYVYGDRTIKLTFRYLAGVNRQLETAEGWIG